MKHNLRILLATAGLLLSTCLCAKSIVPEKQMFMFGFAASFNDTIVVFTDIQPVDSTWIDSKTKFLLARESYSQQFRNYLNDQKHLANRTCVVVYGQNRNKLEKTYKKMLDQYQGKPGKKATNGFDVRFAYSPDFRFKAVNMADQTNAVEHQPKAKPQKKAPKAKPGKAPKKDKKNREH